MPASADSCDWGDFPETVLHFAGPEAPCVDLRVPVTQEQIGALARLGLGGQFGILTGEDPMGVTQSRERNEELAARLHRDVIGSGVPFALVDACNHDRSHCEHSIAVATSRDAAIALACRYAQLAIFWFDGCAFWIVPAMSSKKEVRLPIAR